MSFHLLHLGLVSSRIDDMEEDMELHIFILFSVLVFDGKGRCGDSYQRNTS